MITMENTKHTTKSKPYGVRLDPVERRILDKLINKFGLYASDIFRAALMLYAESEGVETDRAGIVDELRRESAING